MSTCGDKCDKCFCFCVCQSARVDGLAGIANGAGRLAGFGHSVAESSKRAPGLADFGHSVADFSKLTRTVRDHSKRGLPTGWLHIKTDVLTSW